MSTEPLTSGSESAPWQRYRPGPAAAEGVYETDLTGRITWASPSLTAVLGWTPDQVIGMPSADLVHPLDADRMAALRNDIYDAGRSHDATSCMVRTAAGSYRSVTLWARPLLDDSGGVTGVTVTVKDAHDRDAALRALTTLSEANRTLVRSTDEQVLLQRTCDTITTSGRYLLAWYGRPNDDPERTVTPVASAGPARAYVDDIRVCWADNDLGRGPTGRALRTREPQVIDDFAAAADFTPWHETAQRYGFRCSIALPVIVDDEVDGALMVYAGEVGTFDALAQELLGDLAADLGYGLGRLRATTRLQSILDSMIDPLVIMEGVRDADGALIDLRWIEANDAAVAYNGLPREELIGARLLELFPGQLEHGPLRHYFGTIETGEPTILDDYSYGNELIAEDRRYDIRATKCGDGIALTWRDVTDRHRAAQALADSEHRYRLLAENSTDVIMLSDGETTIRWISAAAELTLGWRPDQMIGHPAYEFIHPDDVPNLQDAVATSTRSGTVIHPRYRWRRPDGSFRWMEAAGRPIPDDGTGSPGRVVSLRDVDAQVRADLALADSERRYRLLAENATDVVLLSEDSRTFSWASDSATAVLGWSPEQLVGMPAVDFIHPDDVPGLFAAIAESSASGAVARVRSRWRRGDGTYCWVESAGRPIIDEAGEQRGRVIAIHMIDEQVRAEQELATSERLFRLLAENSTDVVILSETDLTSLWVSPSVTQALGWLPEDLVGHRASEFLHPDDWAFIQSAFDVDIDSDQRVRLRLRHREGTHLWMDAGVRIVPGEGSEPTRLVIQLRDIEDQVQAELELVAREERYRVLAENASDVVWQVDPDGHLTWTSPSVTRVLGWQPEGIVGRLKLDLIDPSDRERTAREREEVLGGRAIEDEVRVLRPDGSSRWMAMTIHPVPTSEGISRIVSLRDIEDEVRARNQLEFALGHDQLTGLARRDVILSRVEYLRAQLPSHRKLAVLCIGIDALGEVNEAYGHAAGDTVLTAVATRVVETAGRPDAVGRGSGDELLVIQTDLVSGADVADLAERIRESVQVPVSVGGQSLVPTVSVGIATGDPGASAETLLREASLAMRKAKSLGRDQSVFADPTLSVEAEHRISVESAIRGALTAGAFEPWFQPIVELAHGTVVGYEALARWVHAEGVHLPDDFIAIAARSSLITEIDLAMLDPTVAALKRLPEHTFVGLNVTGQTLARTPYADLVIDALDRAGVDPHRLHLEVTETMLLSLDEDIIGKMHRLAERGCSWYVDDFGTGYSSISHLRDLPVRGLKLDKSFTDGIAEGDETSRQLADALVGLANGLDLDTVAEGVETEAQARYLRTLGWRHGQGWLYGKAAPLP